jgi:Peptidase family M23/Putative peptidoglycan binding domain
MAQLPTRTLATLVSLLALLASAAPATSAAGSSADTAALQVALWARGVYAGPVDGLYGPDTTSAVKALQAKLGLPTTGIVGPRTRKALGQYAKTTTLGSRTLTVGMSGWDVAAFQFLLAWHGYPSGSFNGTFSPETHAALTRFQTNTGLPADGLAGPNVLAALRLPPPHSPITLNWPLTAPIGSPFGPRGNRFHAGIDLIAAQGTPVDAAGQGRVVYAGWRDGGWGNEVTIDHGHGIRAIYAHLSQITVKLGDPVTAGQPIGRVGATGDANGPHLHLELRLHGAAIDPLTALPTPPPRRALDPGAPEPLNHLRPDHRQAEPTVRRRSLSAPIVRRCGASPAPLLV